MWILGNVLKDFTVLISKHTIYIYIYIIRKIPFHFWEWKINNNYMISLPIVFMVVERNRHGVCDLMTMIWEKRDCPTLNLSFLLKSDSLVTQQHKIMFIYRYSFVSNLYFVLVFNTVVTLVTSRDLYFVCQKYFDFILLYRFQQLCIYCINDGKNKKHLQWQIDRDANYWSSAWIHHKINHQN